MKTLEEVIKEYAIECGNPFGIDLVAVDIEGCKIIANRFAKEVAKEVLKNASENADLEVTTNNRKTSYKSVSYNSQGLWGVERNIVVVDKQSILNESNIPKL